VDIASKQRLLTELEGTVSELRPTRGLVAPAEFIPLLEETGQIKPVVRWALGEACRQMAVWRAELGSCAPQYVSVNLSAHQLSDRDIVDEVHAALDEAGLEPGSLVLELTETAIMRDVEWGASRLAALKELGVRVAIDDFGVAYSSLQYLQKLPVDVLKIAKPFIDGLSEGDDQAVVPRAIAELGQRLRLDMVAEGIEHSEQLARLQDLGCPHGQGFLFSRPVPPEQLSSSLAAAAAPVPLPVAE
jgi:EAL domain-containing protein (putative c-di-GMP-specific phosphodiesterase class I)